MSVNNPARKRNRLPALLPALACAGLLQACSSPVSKQDSANFQAQLDAGNYAGAADTALRSGQIGPDGKSKNIVWSLNAGAALMQVGDVKRSLAVFDNTEDLMKADDVDTLQSAGDYKFTTYDGVMANTYKALDFLEAGDQDNARVEFNRANDRQRRAEEHFQREAAASAQQMAQSSAGDLPGMLGKAEESKEYRAAVGNLTQLAVYAPFENPFATYLRGIFLLNSDDASDRSQGLDSLRRAAAILGSNPTIESDLAWASAAAKGRKLPPQTWIVFENGQSATFREQRIVLPMVTGQPMTIALPVLVTNAPAYAHLGVRAGATTAETSPVGSFDAVMASEFRKRMPIILASAIAEVALKNGMSVAARESKNVALQLLSTIAANVSTADTRSWTALPKEFQAVRVAVPADGTITLTTADGAPLGNVQVPTDGPSIVYVKVQCVGAKPGLQVIHL